MNPRDREPHNNNNNTDNYTDKILTPLGTKKDVEKKIEQLLDEIRISEQSGEKHFWKKMTQREKVIRKSAEPRYVSEGSAADLPIDGDYVNGSRVFMINCASCHSLEANSQARQTSGPALGKRIQKNT
jgi:hypothetical protein